MESSQNFSDLFFGKLCSEVYVSSGSIIHALGDGVGLTVQLGADVEGAMLVDGADP